MNLKRITGWLDGTLKLKKFKDASVNGLQLKRAGEDVTKVAFAVDGSVRSVKAAAEKGAQMLVVHHGIFWRGHLRNPGEGVKNVIAAAKESNIALYAAHLPLDAHPKYGNNAQLAKYFGLMKVKPAFNYHGNIIGVTGYNRRGCKIGVCSGGAGSFAAEAKRIGCDLYVTGEADWGEKIAAENIGMPMVCGGHYETETFGVKALMGAMKKALKISTVFVSLAIAFVVQAEESEGADSSYIGVCGELVLPQGGGRMDRLGGAGIFVGHYLNDWLAVEGAAMWMENRGGLSARAVIHWRGWDEYDMLFGFSRLDPFFTLGAKGWMNDGEVGPSAGIGALYYLSDEWAIRAGGEATLGLDGDTEMVYSISVGIQFSF